MAVRAVLTVLKRALVQSLDDESLRKDVRKGEGPAASTASSTSSATSRCTVTHP